MLKDVTSQQVKFWVLSSKRIAKLHSTTSMVVNSSATLVSRNLCTVCPIFSIAKSTNFLVL